MDALRCPPEDALVANLSGGERRRVALCRLLLQQPDILLLDEPTNHLDAESVEWLEHHLQQYAGTVIAITHDRYFLDNVAGWILELDRGEGIPWKGNYSSWLEQKTARMAMEEKQASKRRKTLERELEWVRMAPKARHAKGKARLDAYDKLLNEDQKEREEQLEIFIPNGPPAGNKVVEAVDVAKGYGDKLLFEHLNFMLPPNGIVGGHRAERGGQDHPLPPYHGDGATRPRYVRSGRDGQDWLRGPGAHGDRPEQDRVRGHLGRHRVHPRGWQGNQRPRLLVAIQLHGRRPGKNCAACCRAASATACIWH